MPCKPNQSPTTPEKKTIRKFARSQKRISCPNCGGFGTIHRNGRAGKLKKLTFRCKCTKNIGIDIMDKMLERFSTPSPSPQTQAPAEFLSSLSCPSAPSPSSCLPPQPLTLDTPSPASRTSAFAPGTPSPLNLPAVQDPVEEISPTLSVTSSAADNSILQRLEALERKIATVEKSNTTLMIANKRLEAKCKRLQSEILATKKIADQASSSVCKCKHAATSGESTAPGPSSQTSVQPRNNAASVPRNSLPVTYAQTVRETPVDASKSMASVPKVASTVTSSPQNARVPSIPDTYAGKILTKIMHSSKAPAPINQSEQLSTGANDPRETSPQNTTQPRREYKPPQNLPPVATWTVSYFRNVPWTKISTIRRTLKACNIQTSKIVNLAWRKGKVLEVILDRNIEEPFTRFLELNLNWTKTPYNIVPSDAQVEDNELFSKPPAHIAIMSFFAAIKRQAPTQQIAYFLRDHAISLLTEFSDAPFEQLWDSAGHLERVPETNAALSA